MDYTGVLGVFKNESHIIREWILHYIYHGIDRIYLLNDGSTDDFMPKIKDLLIRFKEKIQLKHVNSKDLGEKWEGRQILLYNKYFFNILKEVYWLGVFDMDEFIWCPYAMNLNNSLSGFEKYDEIIIPWQCFGSNGHIVQPPSIVKYFNKKALKSLHEYDIKEYSGKYWNHKSFAKTSEIQEIRHHFNKFYNLHGLKDEKHHAKHNITKERFHYLKSINVETGNNLQLNHYMCQSKSNYFNIKAITGSCNNNKLLVNGKKTGDLFGKIDLNDEEDLGLWEQNKIFQKELMEF